MGDNERLCAIEIRLRLKRFPPPGTNVNMSNVFYPLNNNSPNMIHIHHIYYILFDQCQSEDQTGIGLLNDCFEAVWNEFHHERH